MLAHGSSFLLHDRFLNCSDLHHTFLCHNCGSLLSPQIDQEKVGVNIGPGTFINCRTCKQEKRPANIKRIVIPYITRLLTNELAAMNIRLTLEVKPLM